jgi:hypothetical protein
MRADEGERALVPLPAGGAGLTPADILGRASRLALGAAGLALTVLEVLLEAERRAVDAGAALGGRLPPPLRVVARPAAAVVRAPLVVVWRRLDLDGWAARGRVEQRRNQQVAAATARALVGAVAAAVLEQVDVDAVVARVDLDRIVDRIDLDRVAARLDLDAIAARIDVDAVVARLDLAGLTEQVMDEIDLGEIIRESSGTMATETVDALRVQGMRADRLLSRVVDSVLRRRDERDTAGP